MLLSHSLYYQFLIMVSSFHLTSVFRHLFSVLSQCIYNMYTIASMVFLILSMLAGIGAGIVYPAPEANGMPLLIPINHDVCLSATSRRPLSHGAQYNISYFCDGSDAAWLFIALAGAKVRMKQRKSACIFFQKNCKSSQIDILVK